MKHLMYSLFGLSLLLTQNSFGETPSLNMCVNNYQYHDCDSAGNGGNGGNGGNSSGRGQGSDSRTNDGATGSRGNGGTYCGVDPHACPTCTDCGEREERPQTWGRSEIGRGSKQLGKNLTDIADGLKGKSTRKRRQRRNFRKRLQSIDQNFDRAEALRKQAEEDNKKTKAALDETEAYETPEELQRKLKELAERYNKNVDDIVDQLPDVDGPPQTAPNAFPEHQNVQIARSYNDYAKQQIQSMDDAARRSVLTEYADSLLLQANQKYSLGLVQVGDDVIAAALEITDIALSLTPFVGWGKDIYEAWTGKNLVTGKELNKFEHSMAVFGAVTAGIGSKVGTVAKIFGKSGKAAEAANNASRIAKKADAAGTSPKQVRETAAEVAKDLTPEKQLDRLGDVLDTTAAAKLPPEKATQLAKSLNYNKLSPEKATEVLNVIKKDPNWQSALKSSPAGKKTDFYVRPNGEAIPSTGYRHFGDASRKSDEIIKTGKVDEFPWTKDGDNTYFGFNKIDDPAQAKSTFQTPSDQTYYRMEFDTKQVLDDVDIPYGDWGSSKSLEPITNTKPEWGEGGGYQAITNQGFEVDKIVDLRNGEVLYEK